MELEPIVKTIMSNPGPWGLVCVLLIVCWQLYKEIQAANKARIDDAKAATDMILKHRTEDMEAKHRIESLLDEFERRSG